ncbi:MAG TPA: helix-turn-helix domain-containing protein [Candidatus Limnocylindrales bacterium]
MTAGPRVTAWDSVPVVLDVCAAGQLLGLGRNATYAAVQSGELPSIRIGRRVLISRDAIRRMLEGEARS